jgi:hypothetical protein
MSLLAIITPLVSGTSFTFVHGDASVELAHESAVPLLIAKPSLANLIAGCIASLQLIVSYLAEYQHSFEQLEQRLQLL